MLKYKVSPDQDTLASSFNAANYARIEPNRSGSATFLNGYLRATFNSALETAFYTLPKRRGKFVVEVTRNAPSTANAVGAGLANSSLSGSTWLGSNTDGFCLYSENFGIFEGGSQVSSTPVWNDTNTSFVMAVDMTGDNPVVSFVLDLENSIDTTYTWTNGDLNAEDMYLAISGSSTDSITLNTGRLPWRNRNIRRLFPDYIIGWPGIIEEDVILYKASAAAPTVVTLNGQEITSQQGTLSITGAANVAILGQQINSAQGGLTVVAGGAVTVNLSGQQAAVSQGTLNVVIATLVNLNGQEITSQQGSIALQTANNITLAGQLVTSQQGVVTVTGDLPDIPDEGGITIFGDFGEGKTVSGGLG